MRLRRTSLELNSTIILITLMVTLLGQLVPLSAGATEASRPTVTTGKDDYAANEVVDMYGSGFGAAATYQVVVVRPDGSAVIYDRSESGLHGEELCYDADASDGTDCYQSVTADTSGSWTNLYQLNGLSGEYRINVYDADAALVATATFTDAATLGFTGSDGARHTTSATQEDLGTVPAGSDLVLTCPRGTGLTFSGTNFGTIEVVGWTIDYFFGPSDDGALLRPITTMSPTSGSISGAEPSDCIALTIDTDTLTVGETYEGILQVTTAEAGGKTRALKYFFRFTIGEPPVSPLDVTKTVTTSSEKVFGWNIDKTVDRTLVRAAGGTATFNYTVTVSRDDGSARNWQVSGTITVENPNSFAVSSVEVTDDVDNGGTCVVEDGADVTVAAASSVLLDYTCSYASAPSATSGTNIATATWPTTGSLPGGSDSDSKPFAFSDPTIIDGCVAVTDTFDGTTTDLGTVCHNDPNPSSFAYSRTVAVPQSGCRDHDNTATFTSNDMGIQDSSSRRVTVCGPDDTGARTIGFWRNKNGQGIILNSSASRGTCNVATWLRQFAPFQDLGSRSSCSQTGSYVLKVIDSANAGGTTMNPMLKAQMLATALNVYFSNPALGGNQIGAPVPLGGFVVDLTYVCAMANDADLGSSCTGAFQDVSGAFGGSSSLTVFQMLTYAASRSNSGGSVWYGNVKSVQEWAKNAFDAINNEVAFSP